MCEVLCMFSSASDRNVMSNNLRYKKTYLKSRGSWEDWNGICGKICNLWNLHLECSPGCFCHSLFHLFSLTSKSHSLSLLCNRTHGQQQPQGPPLPSARQKVKRASTPTPAENIRGEESTDLLATAGMTSVAGATGLVLAQMKDTGCKQCRGWETETSPWAD